VNAAAANMQSVSFIDTTLRDGHHSLWAQGMRTGMMISVAELMDEMGFRAMEVIGNGHFKKCIRELKENPWDRISLVGEKVRRTPLAFMMLASVTTFDVTPYALVRLYIQRLATRGIRRIQIMESSNDLNNRIPTVIGFMREAGVSPALALVYSLSPRHTDEHYAEKTRTAVKLKPDVIYLKDPAGLLTPERIKTLLPVIMANAAEIPVELHSHCTTGLAPVCYADAVALGCRILHTALPPLADGSSLPSLITAAKNVESLGLRADVHLANVETVTRHFTGIALREGLPIGRPVDYDVAQYIHHVPGGVISHLRHQLTQIGQRERLPEVLKEIARVRKDLGYPIMVTPFSQFVCSQATLNVIIGERYAQVSDEIIHFAGGHWGAEAASLIDPNIRDRILGHSRAKAIFSRSTAEPDLGDIRKRYGEHLSDEELLLHYIAPSREVEAMHAAGLPRAYALGNPSLLGFAGELNRKGRYRRVRVRKGNMSVSISGPALAAVPHA
jgi:oxaloacetate decarboxylase alpha subunit